MKKGLCLMLILSLCLCLNAVLAQVQFSSNPSTFETFEEACVNGPIAMSEELGGNYISNPCLEKYPEGTTYIYRSAARWSATSAGYRKNTTLLVYTDDEIADKDAALAYITELGLVDIVEECKGSVVLVTPSNKTSFSSDDAYAYYLLQTAMMNLGGTATIDDVRYTTAEGAYYGGTTYRYVIGIGGGATFINNYIAPTFDDVTRIAGMLLIGGDMDRIHDVAGIVPVYMVDPCATAVAKYKDANETDATAYLYDVDIYFNQQQQLQKVMVTSGIDNAAAVKDAYYNLFIKAQRIPVVVAGLYTANQDYTNVNWNQAPYSLAERNAFFGYKTDDGLIIEEFIDTERFAEYSIPEGTLGVFGSPAEVGKYIDTWYEVMPEEVVNGTAAEHSVPLWLALHGGGDDPLQFLDEMGLMDLAGEERFAMIAPLHVPMFTVGMDVLPPIVEYILDKYPALDPSRVYVTGYSMGGGATLHAINGNASMFAAAVPQAAAIFGNDDEIVDLDDVEMPILFTTATYDFCGFNITAKPEQIHQVYQNRINDYLTLNGMPTVEYDFDTYPISGFRGDLYVEMKLNNEYMNRTWMFINDKGIPMVGLNVTDYMPHGLWQEFGRIAWEFAKHYSRDLETGEVIYSEYVK